MVIHPLLICFQRKKIGLFILFLLDLSVFWKSVIDEMKSVCDVFSVIRMEVSTVVFISSLGSECQNNPYDSLGSKRRPHHRLFSFIPRTCSWVVMDGPLSFGVRRRVNDSHILCLPYHYSTRLGRVGLWIVTSGSSLVLKVETLFFVWGTHIVVLGSTFGPENKHQPSSFYRVGEGMDLP